MATSSKRRPYHTGSVTSTSTGKWLVRISVIDPRDGRRRFRARRVAGTKTQAEAALAALKREVLAAKPSLLHPSVTLNQLIERHLERGTKLATGTRRTYESLWHKWLENGIGKVRAAEVAAYHYAELWKQMEVAGLSRSTMNSAYALIKGAYRTAAKYDEFSYNVARFEPPPRPEPFLREHLSDETLIAIINAAAKAPESYWPFVVRLALATGCRRGELAAMRWNALDDGWLSVRNSVDFHEGEMVLSNTKNDQPRTIALDDETAELWRSLREHADRVHQADLGHPLSREAFVLAGDPSGTKPVRPDSLSKQWRALCDDADVGDVEFREMRNWHATTLDIDFDYSVESIGRRLGHSQARSRTRVTQRYITTMKDRDRRMSADIAGRLAMLA